MTYLRNYYTYITSGYFLCVNHIIVVLQTKFELMLRYCTCSHLQFTLQNERVTYKQICLHVIFFLYILNIIRFSVHLWSEWWNKNPMGAGCYGPCDHIACHFWVLLSDPVPLPPSCHDSGGDPGRQTLERKTGAVRGVRRKRSEDIAAKGGKRWYGIKVADRNEMNRKKKCWKGLIGDWMIQNSENLK